MSVTLNSRNSYSSGEQFRDDFIDTLMPGVIPRQNFIQWQTIQDKVRGNEELFSFFDQLCLDDSDEAFKESFAQALLSADNPAPYIKTLFELLAHTGDTFVSRTDDINIVSFWDDSQREQKAEYIAGLAVDLGVRNILSLELLDYFTGVQVGLETHRRKNIGGNAFVSVVEAELEHIRQELSRDNIEMTIESEQQILYTDEKTGKRADILLTANDRKVGIELNFYSSPGSKPTEIKRSYGQVNQRLDEVGVPLVWITDGAGYRKMRKSLSEAWEIHKNIYNFNMVREHLTNDLRLFFTQDND